MSHSFDTGLQTPSAGGGTAAALAPALVEAVGVSKQFPGVKALEDVHMHLAAGEVLCIVGENGAGKSTLMKIIGGVYTPDAGEIRIDGRPARIASVIEAQRQGIVLIHQELNLAEGLDVAGNLFLGREPRFGGRLGLIHRRIYAEAEAITSRLGLDCSPRTPVSRLSLGQKQLVEIGRALSLRSRLIIMDEPTSSLTTRETERLFEVIRDLKRDGVSLLYISHRLKEVQDIADRVTVLRDGRNAGELARSEVTHDALVRLMVGREAKQFFHAPPVASSQHSSALPLIAVRNLTWSDRQPQGIAFDIHPGEVVGMAGLMGSGRTELAETIFGLRRARTGQVAIDGRPLRLGSPRGAIAAGVYLVPEDRRHQGLLLASSVRENISLASLDRLNRMGLVRRAAEVELARRTCQQLGVRTPSVAQIVGLLSGGNQQKVVLGKWLCRGPRLLILDEPTRGIDVGAKSEIYTLVYELAARGVAVLMISSDLEEILGTCQRVLVMHDGRLAGALGRDQFSEQAVMHLATGGDGAQ